MKKLNNKGITTIEVLLCFIIVVIIATSMFSTISSFNERRIIEQYKEKVYTYQELLTKEIQDDFILVGLTHVKYTRRIIGEDPSIPKGTVVHTVDCELKDGTKRRLNVYQGLIESDTRINTNVISNDTDYFMIEYGDLSSPMKYPIPDLGESEAFPGDESKTGKVKDFTINNVLIKIEADAILSIYIGFYHPELGTKYGIDITAPIGFDNDGTTVGSKLFDGALPTDGPLLTP